MSNEYDGLTAEAIAKREAFRALNDAFTYHMTDAERQHHAQQIDAAKLEMFHAEAAMQNALLAGIFGG